MRINTNVAALNSYNQLNKTNSNLSKSLERLSSGKRINGAADDAAGLAISEKMGSQTRGLAQAQRNAQDAISMNQTAEGALKESHSILQRMRELSVQSANDTNTDADRAEIQEEVNQLSKELTRISETTEFNTQKLLDGSLENTFQIGANEGQQMKMDINNMSAEALSVAGMSEAEVTENVSATEVPTTGETSNFSIEENSVVAGNIGAITEETASVAGVSDTATVEDAGGDTLTISDPTVSNASVTIEQNGSDTLAVDGTGGNLTISLANTSPGNNTAANIETAVQALGTVDGTDFSGWTFTAGGTWDTNATGGTLTTATDTLSGRVEEVQGEYNFDLENAFVTDGDSITVGTQSYTFGSGNDFTGETVEEQVESLAEAINNDGTNILNATADGANLQLTEEAGSATGNFITTDVTSSGISGEYSFEVTENFEEGEQLTIGDETLTFTENNPSAADGEVQIGATETETADNIATYLEDNVDRWAAGTDTNSDTEVKLAENVAQGEDVESLEVGHIGDVQAEYSFGLDEKLEAGDHFEIDGEQIDVVEEGANGTTEINAGETLEDQATNLASAISNNGSIDYSATASGSDITMTQQVADADAEAPEIFAGVEGGIDVSSQEAADNAISVIDDAIANVSSERSKLGAVQNRLEHTINNLNTSEENLTAAESRISDVDMAREMMNMSKQQILSQAGTAMMAQANQLPQGVLQLLG